MNNSDTRSVPNTLFFRLFQTGNVLQRQVQKEMGISTVQWAVLGALSRERYEGGISFFELTEYLFVGDDPNPHGPLYVTHVFARGADGWHLICRHASAADLLYQHLGHHRLQRLRQH